MANLVFTSREPDYKDLDLDFLEKKSNGEYFNMVRSGEEAIKRSVRNLIFSNFYERPFRSFIGCSARQLLFENANPITATYLENAIKNVIENFEPRVSVLLVRVSVDNDRNGFNAELQYMIKNSVQPVLTSIFLERIR